MVTPVTFFSKSYDLIDIFFKFQFNLKLSVCFFNRSNNKSVLFLVLKARILLFLILVFCDLNRAPMLFCQSYASSGDRSRDKGINELDKNRKKKEQQTSTKARQTKKY